MDEKTKNFWDKSYKKYSEYLKKLFHSGAAGMAGFPETPSEETACDGEAVNVIIPDIEESNLTNEK